MLTSKASNLVVLPTPNQSDCLCQKPLTAQAYDLPIDENTILTVFRLSQSGELRLGVSQVFTKVPTLTPDSNPATICQILALARQNLGFTNERVWVRSQLPSGEFEVDETLSLNDAVKLWVVSLHHYPDLANFCAHSVTQLLHHQIQQVLDTEGFTLPSEYLEPAFAIVKELTTILAKVNQQHEQDSQMITHLEDCLLACEEERRGFALQLQHWEQLFGQSH